MEKAVSRNVCYKYWVSTFLFLLIICWGNKIIAQTPGIGMGTQTPHPSAALEISDTSRGILIPRMTMSQRLGINSPAEGLMVYQTDSTYGYWFYARGEWRPVISNVTTNQGNSSQTPLSYVFPDTILCNWFEAIEASSRFSYNGYSDWRVPTQEEMTKLIIQYGSSIFPAAEVGYWTSTTHFATSYNQFNNFNIYLYVNGIDRNGIPCGPVFKPSWGDLTQLYTSSVAVEKKRKIYIR